MLRVRAVPITPPKSPEVVLPNPDAGHGRRLTVAFEVKFANFYFSVNRLFKNSRCHRLAVIFDQKRKTDINR